MGAPGLNELKNKFALTPSSQTSSSGSSLQVQLLPSILCTEGGPLAKFLGIACPLMRGCLLNISLHHTWKLPTKTDSSSESLRAEQMLLPDSSWLLGENFRTSKGEKKKMNAVIPGPNGIWWGSSVCTDSLGASKSTPKVPLSSCSGWNSLIWSSWRYTVEWLLLPVSSNLELSPGN